MVERERIRVRATNQNAGNFVQNIDCLLGSSLLLGPIVGWHILQNDF